MLLKSMDSWIDRSRQVFQDVAESGVAPACPKRFLLPEPPEGLPAIDVLMVGQPGAGKSTLGNLLLGYRQEPLVRDVALPQELPRFQEEMVSVARRFADRYKGSQSIPVSAVQAASLPSLPAVLGVRFTEMWGMDRSRPVGEITGPLLDAHPQRAVLVLVVRADQQLDEPERELLGHIATSPWRSSVLVVLNMRTRQDDAEEVIKLKGFVEEQCVALTVKPRGVFAFNARDGESPVPGEFARFEETLSTTLARRWSPENRERLRGVLASPVEEARGAILDALELPGPSEEALKSEIERVDGEIERELRDHDEARTRAGDEVRELSERAVHQMEDALKELDGDRLSAKPREVLRTFRRESIGAIESSLGPCRETGDWPVPDMSVLKKPGPGCGPIAAAVVSLVVAVVTALLLQWIITAVFGGLFALFVTMTVVLFLRARDRWYEATLEQFQTRLGEQRQHAMAAIDALHEASHSARVLVPAMHARRQQLIEGLDAVRRLDDLSADLDEAIRDARGESAATEAVPSPRPGQHARRLAAALASGTPLNAFFHENGFDLEAPDLFGRICEVEYALRPMASLTSVQTVRDWLRPPLARREKSIYSFLDRLRIRHDELDARTRAVAQRILRRSADEGAPLPVRVKVQKVSGQSPRLALAEEALERILARILDEAVKHGFGEGAARGAVEMTWELQTDGAQEPCAVLEVALHGARGFDEAGRRAFDSGRGGLARFLADPEEGALGWCSSVQIVTVDGERVLARVVDGTEGRFQQREEPKPAWATCFVLRFPALIQEGGGGV